MLEQRTAGGDHSSYLSANVYAPGWQVREEVSKSVLQAFLKEEGIFWLHLEREHFRPMLSAAQHNTEVKPPKALLHQRMMG